MILWRLRERKQAKADHSEPRSKQLPSPEEVLNAGDPRKLVPESEHDAVWAEAEPHRGDVAVNLEQGPLPEPAPYPVKARIRRGWHKTINRIRFG